jgi:hypothetical protein
MRRRNGLDNDRPVILGSYASAEYELCWQQVERHGVWSSDLACRDCGMTDLPVEGTARCRYCYELWLLQIDPITKAVIAAHEPQAHA